MKISQSVIELLRTWHRQQSGELLTRLGVSRPSLMRAITELGDQVVSRGRARRTTYAARRGVRGAMAPLMLYSVDTKGKTHEVGQLEPVYPTGCAMDFTVPFPWPLDDEMKDGWFRGLPYPLADMRPQGFLGRNFAHQYASILQVDDDVTRWSEDDVLHVLSTVGFDQPGNYILGEPALRRFYDEQQKSAKFLDDDNIINAFPELAQQALNFGVVGSSAAGEFPKFTARRMGKEPRHVIVKFSGSDNSPQEQRWSDLLVCEHLALSAIADTLKVPAANSRIYQFGGRTFYEVDRFDRHGEVGRSGVCSWHEINFALFGKTGSWSEGANDLFENNDISEDTQHQIKLLEHFGRLIANTDMHDGNLGFRPHLILAPAYDMLPMFYAPQRGVELVDRKFMPLLPAPRDRPTWIKAAEAATVFWYRAAGDQRISDHFRMISAANAKQIDLLIRSQRD
ncbi:type II toxin-antitoxin system HipA family toxin YjjJ [Undibacterium sp. RTI2.1]|uniref:type II toxin-antitoxin system HipA family toxin YjjJ n=1 Tax=unclassified Undibacterium TaxID=2630295 RepID=UPI002AB35691|nr:MULTISPECIES: type II toxin-antitoxin system HipA family toxin YjjJ [unclassified Undibacterium]MDY7540763.1 type II toxin-antitoxin system HipA family toxin YjjJ [Undibacterium sp. 5I1]MEB0032305.1 type II toxin-antitoxin system HipA family toxin YjjJ [Undibacterium sp. RTI2.1]MEB0118448.1 type II toxin-antitoxin system HipA family toxin YjjJ [Undibacterium sp. RTI2.2]MEB0233148.1 type II toxin-antitoxin system HipA family toxin YjjJ [Undibacterium sp. 10I3]MEB0259433.1 type II toxin-antit